MRAVHRLLWDHPNSPATLKKHILRTVLEEVVADTTDDPPTVRLKLHWAGRVHTSSPCERTGPVITITSTHEK